MTAGTSYGIVGAAKGKDEKDAALVVLWLFSLCHLVFPTCLLGSGGSTGTER